MSQTKKKKVVYLTIHASKPLKARFKKVFGRWKESQLDQDESKNPTQKEFMDTMLDLAAAELGVDL